MTWRVGLSGFRVQGPGGTLLETVSIEADDEDEAKTAFAEKYGVTSTTGRWTVTRVRPTP